MKLEDKIKILLSLGFKKDEEYNDYYLNLEKGKDRFQACIIYQNDNDSFYFIRHKLSGVVETTREEIMNNHNNLQTTSKEHFLRIEEELRKHNIKLVNS